MSNPGKFIHVLIADKHPVMCEGFCTVLEEVPHIDVVGKARDSAEVQQMVARLCPDIVVLNLMMPGIQLFEVNHWICTNHPGTHTLVLAEHDLDRYLAQAVQAGVAGIITKAEPPQKLVEAIYRVACGEAILTREQLARAHAWQMEVGQRWENLTKREREVLTLLAQGQSNAKIAESLAITVRTVETHVGHLLKKLDVAAAREAKAWVWKHEIFDDLELST